jgi:hypothetical protein
MTDSRGPAGSPEPAAGPPAATAPGGPAGVDPVAVIRSKRYFSALILAGILGIPISVVAYGFLAQVAKIQSYLFDELPAQVTGGPTPAWRRGCSARSPRLGTDQVSAVQNPPSTR